MESAVRELRGTLLRVTDANGIVGYGFIIEHGGLEQLSVTWPDRAAERFTQEMAELHKLRTEDAFPALTFGQFVVEEDEPEDSQSAGLDIATNESQNSEEAQSVA